MLFTHFFCNAEINFTFSLAPHIGLTYGQFDEILYDTTGKECSLLEWEQKPLLNFGLSAEITINRLLILSGFEYGLQIGTPVMHDSDWDDGIKYSYTTHPLKTSKEINTQLLIAYRLYSDYIISIIPEIDLQYMYNTFNAGEGSGTRYKRQIRVYGVDYSRHTFLIFTGLRLSTKIKQVFTLTTGLLVSPYTYQYGFDYHNGVKHPFTSIGIQESFFSKIKIKSELDFACTDRFSLILNSTILFGNTDKGVFYSDYYTDNITLCTDQKSGAKLWSAKIGLDTKFKIF